MRMIPSSKKKIIIILYVRVNSFRFSLMTKDYILRKSEGEGGTTLVLKLG